MDWTACQEPGCTQPAVTIYHWTVKGVGMRGQNIVLHMDRRNCVDGHYYDVEVYEDDA